MIIAFITILIRKKKSDDLMFEIRKIISQDLGNSMQSIQPTSFQTFPIVNRNIMEQNQFAVKGIGQNSKEKLICSDCGFENPVGNRYCGDCGKKLQ